MTTPVDDIDTPSTQNPHAPRPWAETPAAHHRIAPFGPFSAPLHLTPPALFSKERVLELLQLLTSSGHDVGPLPTLCHRAEQITDAATHCFNHGWKELVLKQAFSAAGRGNHRFDHAPPTDTPALTRALRSGPLLVEPWFPEARSFSLHFDYRDSRVIFRGLVHQETDGHGRWTGSRIAPDACSTTVRSEEENAILSRILSRDADHTLAPALCKIFRNYDYEGPIGVDALLWRDENKSLHWRPATDINVRWTMGRLALAFQEKLCPSHTLRLSSISPAEAAGLPGPRIEDGKLAAGTLALTDPSSAVYRVIALHI